MSTSYKILSLGAVILIVGIVSYHWVQSSYHPDPADSVITTPPTNGPPPYRPSTATNDTSSQPGIGDLMTRIRTHLDQANQAPVPSPVETTPQSIPAQPDTTEAKSTPVTEKEVGSPTPVVTFDLPSNAPKHPSANAVQTPSATVPTGTGQTEAAPPPATATKVQPAVQPSNQPKNYTVQPGDTFSTIAVKIYGSQKQWIDIAIANPFVDAKRLQIGQTIRLPHPEDIMGRDEDAPLQDPGKIVTHVVRPGDSLSSISNRYYNNPDQWRVIFDTNRDKIGPNPDRLSAGQILRIPPQHIPAQ